MKNILISFLLLSFSATAQKKITVGNGSALSYSAITLIGSGIISDADLSFGSSSFATNQTAAIQAILNTATATVPLNLIWDARVSITGLKIKSNTIITALPNCGAILRDSANDFIFYKY